MFVGEKFADEGGLASAERTGQDEDLRFALHLKFEI